MDKAPKSCFLSLLLVISYAGSVNAFSAVPLAFVAAGATIANIRKIPLMRKRSEGKRKSIRLDPIFKFATVGACFYAALKLSQCNSLSGFADRNRNRGLGLIIGTIGLGWAISIIIMGVGCLLYSLFF